MSLEVFSLQFYYILQLDEDRMHVYMHKWTVALRLQLLSQFLSHIGNKNLQFFKQENFRMQNMI